MFDSIFTTKPISAMLNAGLKGIHRNKAELLLVLERPDIPIDNNGPENAIREYGKKRKISGAPEVKPDYAVVIPLPFTSLKKTCRKLGISFWQYLKDRIENSSFQSCQI